MREALILKKKTEDRRIQKTLSALQAALISLMSEKSYESIVIQEILDRANIGRSTFYTHFRDKDELLVYGLQGLRALLRNAQMAIPPSSAKGYERTIGFSLAMFEHAHDHRKIYRSLIGGQGWSIFRQHFEEMLVQLMKEEAGPLFKKKGPYEVRSELFIHFLASTFLSVMTWWFNYRTPISPKEINALFRELVVPALSAWEIVRGAGNWS